jgi:hypothetical protein
MPINRQELDAHFQKQNLKWPTASQEELLNMVSQTEWTASRIPKSIPKQTYATGFLRVA